MVCSQDGDREPGRTCTLMIGEGTPTFAISAKVGHPLSLTTSKRIVNLTQFAFRVADFANHFDYERYVWCRCLRRKSIGAICRTL